jgi:trimeric autotransporter adhesin
MASEYHGQVTFNDLPIPGVTVTAIQGSKKVSTVTDVQGAYSFPDLADGNWTIQTEMLGFAALNEDVTITPKTAAGKWALKLLPLDQIEASTKPTAVLAPAPTPLVPGTSADSQKPPTPGTPAPPAPRPLETAQDDLNQRAADGFLINGSSNNGAASPFAQSGAFGNNRNGSRKLYNGQLGITFDNSALDARTYSLAGQNTAKPDYNRMTGLLYLGGPLQIPKLMKNGPNFFVAYQWTRNNNASTLPALMPTEAQRNGILSTPVVDPTTGAPFVGNIIPQNRISPQARSLLNLYPLPNFQGNSQYNYQIPIVGPTHQDALQSRLMKNLNMKNQVYGTFAFQDTRTDTPSVFGFQDKSGIFGINTGMNWSHRFNQRWSMNLGYKFSYLSTRITPNFENRENISGEAGITGNNQDPVNWGPPSLIFSSGIQPLSDQQSSFNRNETNSLSSYILWNHRSHNVNFGSDFRRQEYNYLSQQDPRGTFTFTGVGSGSDFANFLLGSPDVSSIAFGNADKYFRQSAYDGYLNDDWRVSPELTLNLGVRWEYGAPITERYGRLVNLDVAPGFTAVSPVIATNPTGTLTGTNYPSSLVRPDKSAFEPRLGLAWRPLSGSSMVIRAGYGVYYDTSVYQNIATQMAQQPPLSKSLSVQNSAASPLTLANGFIASPNATANTFAIDPNFRVGYAQVWKASVQRDLPGSLQLTATYIGIKGTRGPQEFLPNTYPLGSTLNPCPTCPSGFYYVTSNGNSTRESGQVQLRRRLHNGFTATLLYTYSKSIDNDAALGGQIGSSNTQASGTQSTTGQASFAPAPTTTAGPTNFVSAQNWLNLSAERGLSSFDQRHLLNLQLQYTTGMGSGGGTLMSGWRGALFKEWTFASQITAGTGLPQTPIYLAPVQGTGITGTIRPQYTGAPLYAAPAGAFLNPAAYVAPLAGQWGDAGRNSITGPNQFTLNATLARTFRLTDRLNLFLSVDSTNPLNHVTYTTWNTTVNNAQFGFPASANAMRSLQTTLRLRF